MSRVQRKTCVTTMAVCLALLLSGCSKQPEEAVDPYPDMSTELRAMQGSWTDVNTNDSVDCSVIVQGYTIRVRYQAAPEETVKKQNASIERLDEARNLILVNGGSGAWPYEYLKNNGTETLKLEYYTPTGWFYLNLNRADPSGGHPAVEAE